jgi:hypothetical protein
VLITFNPTLTLKHLEFIANGNAELTDGQRWEASTGSLVTFNFMFGDLHQLVPQALDSFRTSFWLECKRRFVAYVTRSIFSVLQFTKTKTGKNFESPIYPATPMAPFFTNALLN